MLQHQPAPERSEFLAWLLGNGINAQISQESHRCMPTTASERLLLLDRT